MWQKAYSRNRLFLGPNRPYWRELRPLVTPWVKSIKEGTDPWRNQKWALLSQCPGELPSSLSLSFPSLALLCFSILCCSYLLVKGLTGQANLFLNIASGKNSLSLSLSSSSPQMGRLYYRGTGYLASIISIDPQMGWLHYSGTGYLAIISIDPKMGWLHYSGIGCLATIISINPLPYPSPLRWVGCIIGYRLSRHYNINRPSVGCIIEVQATSPL